MPDREDSYDFRKGMINTRLNAVRRLLLVLSGKGGVGKSVVSAALAAILADSGFSVGLMDADIYGPSSTLILGTRSGVVEGRMGLAPPVAKGVEVMSVDLFAPDQPVPLTGEGARQVITEMLALTHWGPLDCLIIDMPPATSDIMMQVTNLRRKGLSAVVVTTPDKLSLVVAHRVLQLLSSGRVPITGVLGNMHSRLGGTEAKEDGPAALAREFKVPFLGKLPYDSVARKFANEGDVDGLLRTSFSGALRRSAGPYFKLLHRPFR